MSLYVIHILLLDGKILCTYYKELSTRVLIKHLCNYLNLERPKTVGLLYKDSRGSLQWLEESKLILDHDIATDEDFIPLILKIRHIPHHICYNEANIYQLFLLSVRLLKQNWFIPQPDIHSQLVALYILFKGGRDLSESEIEDAINQSKLANDNLLTTIANAYLRYREKLNSMAEYLLKILQLTTRFPIFNSKLFVVADSRSQKFVLGINSQNITLFQLDQFHNPFMIYKYSDIENVMNRGIKIIVDLKYQKSMYPNDSLVKPMIYDRIGRRKELDNQRSSDNIKKRSLTPSRYNSENEMVIFYALSPHQSSCIYSEIQASLTEFREASSVYKISDLMKNANFIQSLNHWLVERYTNGLQDPEGSYNKDGFHMFLDEDVGIDLEDTEILFGEIGLYESDIYQKMSQFGDGKSDIEQKPDFDQLVTEESRIKELLKEKLGQLQESFLMEEKITGSMPKEASQYFPNGIQKFQRNTKTLTLGYHQHRGCAASVRNKFMAMETISQRGINKYDPKNAIFDDLPGSRKASSTGNIISSRSVTDLSSLKSGSPYWKSVSNSNASIRSYEEKKYQIKNKSLSNIFFNDSPRSDRAYINRSAAAIKSKSQSNNLPLQSDFIDNSRSKTKLYNSISEQKCFYLSPRSEIPSNRSSLQPRSTNSSPLISHSASPNKKFFRNHENN